MGGGSMNPWLFTPQFENGKLVKLDGMRPEYMSGFALIRATRHFAELHQEAIDLLASALPYVEEAATDPAHKPGPVNALAQKIRAAVETKL
jgi:hypothetical protein